jgi:hypothetical protein
MAGPYYVRSTDGNDADTGLTWALAKATLAGALAVAAAGERVWVSQAHAETQASAMTLTSAGTAASPVEILCGNDAAEPPTALATTATISTTGNSGITINGFAYHYGIAFNCGSGANSPILSLCNTAGNGQIFDTCTLAILATGTGSYIIVNGANAIWTLVDSKLVFGNVSQVIYAVNGGGMLTMIGGNIAATGSVPTTPFKSFYPGHIRLRGVDLSAFGAGKSLVLMETSAMLCRFEQCKLGASVALTTGAAAGAEVFLSNSDSADTQYRMQLHAPFAGDIYSETTVVRTGGASDGTTPLSHKMVSSANAKFVRPLYGPELVIYNAVVGSAKTATVEIVHDSLTALTDAEVWLEVEYLGTSGFPLSLFLTDRAADILATPADQTASSIAWTTTGLTNPNKQKLAVTFTPQEVGIIRCRVALAKASYTVYVDPLIVVA